MRKLNKRRDSPGLGSFLHLSGGNRQLVVVCSCQVNHNALGLACVEDFFCSVFAVLGELGHTPIPPLSFPPPPSSLCHIKSKCDRRTSEWQTFTNQSSDTRSGRNANCVRRPGVPQKIGAHMKPGSCHSMSIYTRNSYGKQTVDPTCSIRSAFLHGTFCSVPINFREIKFQENKGQPWNMTILCT